MLLPPCWWVARGQEHQAIMGYRGIGWTGKGGRVTVEGGCAAARSTGRHPDVGEDGCRDGYGVASTQATRGDETAGTISEAR